MCVQHAESACQCGQLTEARKFLRVAGQLMRAGVTQPLASQWLAVVSSCIHLGLESCSLGWAAPSLSNDAYTLVSGIGPLSGSVNRDSCNKLIARAPSGVDGPQLVPHGPGETAVIRVWKPISDCLASRAQPAPPRSVRSPAHTIHHSLSNLLGMPCATSAP